MLPYSELCLYLPDKTYAEECQRLLCLSNSIFLILLNTVGMGIGGLYSIRLGAI